MPAIRTDANISEAGKKAAIAALKLGADLTGLAAKLDKAGNYSSGSVVVKASKVSVKISLPDLSEKTLAALKTATSSVVGR